MEPSAGFKRYSKELVMSQDTEDTLNHYRVRGVFGCGPVGRRGGDLTAIVSAAPIHGLLGTTETVSQTARDRC
jgi:hypothetical protein